MKRFRFIHGADLHLDSPFAGMTEIPPAIRKVLRQSTFTALNRLVALAIRVKADFVLLAGDVYDLADRSLRAQIRFQKAMAALAEHGISAYIVHGNHDPADGRAARLTWPPSVHFFSHGEVECVPVVTPDREHVANVYGISYPTAAVGDNYALRFRREGHGPYHIGLLHTNVDSDAGHADYAPCTKEQLARAGMDYWALGHVHGRRVLHEAPHIVYPGNLQGRSIRETGEKGCYVVDVTEEGETLLTFHPLDAVRWLRIPVSIEGAVSEQELKERLEGGLEEARGASGGRPAIVRLELTGRGPLHRIVQSGAYLAELVSELRENEAERVSGSYLYETGNLGDESSSEADFVWIESVRVSTGLDIDWELLASQKSFLGDLIRFSGELGEDDGQLREFAAECLAPLLNHGKAAKVLAGDNGGNGLDPAVLDEWLKAAAEMAVDFLADEEEWDA